jgi:hypothetical protein
LTNSEQRVCIGARRDRDVVEMHTAPHLKKKHACNNPQPKEACLRAGVEDITRGFRKTRYLEWY